MTESTIADRAAFHEELATVRERKYAIDAEERLAGLSCVSAPITDDEDRSVAAISVAFPVHRISDDLLHEELPNAVLGTANVIELSYNYS